MLLTFETFWVFSFFDSSLVTFCFLSLGTFTFGSFFVFCSLFSFFSEFSLSFITFSVVLNSSLSFLTSSGSSVSNYSFLTYELNCFFLNYSALASSPSVPSHLNPDFLPPLSVFSTSPRDLKTLTISQSRRSLVFLASSSTLVICQMAQSRVMESLALMKNLRKRPASLSRDLYLLFLRKRGMELGSYLMAVMVLTVYFSPFQEQWFLQSLSTIFRLQKMLMMSYILLLSTPSLTVIYWRRKEVSFVFSKHQMNLQLRYYKLFSFRLQLRILCCKISCWQWPLGGAESGLMTLKIGTSWESSRCRRLSQESSESREKSWEPEREEPSSKGQIDSTDTASPSIQI